jgi:four helix bundle protein
MARKGYRDLTVWQKAVDLAEEVYALSSRFPREERFGITSQMRRAAVSVSSNIAEGSGRGTTPDLKMFLSYARGSVKETESLLLVTLRLRLVTENEIRVALRLTDEISRILSTLRRTLRRH